MTAPIADRVRELETWMKRIRDAKNVLLNVDMWERWGAAHAEAEERATMATSAAEATRQLGEATAALETLVATTRAEAPAALAAWVDAHDAYLAAFLDECASQGESADTAAFVARNERVAWEEVRAGARAFVDENGFYVTTSAERYRRLFGIDP
jgi:hypothetical protein